MDTILPPDKLRIRAGVYRLFGAMFLAELAASALSSTVCFQPPPDRTSSPTSRAIALLIHLDL